MAQTKRQARDHAILSDIYANTVIQRLGQVTEEVQRIYRRVSNHLLNFYFSFCKKKIKPLVDVLGEHYPSWQPLHEYGFPLVWSLSFSQPLASSLYTMGSDSD